METMQFTSSDGRSISYYRWLPKRRKTIKAVLQIVHGSVEHALRYADFAQYCNEQGIAVYATDHRGHGKSVPSAEYLSYFSDEENGFDIAIEDLKTLNGIIRSENAGAKVFLLGHSMGSFMVRKLIASSNITGANTAQAAPAQAGLSDVNISVDGALLSGTGGGRPFLLHLFLFIAKIEMRNKGRMFRSKNLHNLLFGTLNNEIKGAETGVDFISHDKQVVKAYMEDPLCGVTITTEYGYELVKAIKFCSDASAFESTPKDLPIYIFSGREDPVGGKNGAEVIKIAEQYKSAGVQDLSIKLYESARHETLNEINKQEVYEDTIGWIHQRL